NHFHHVGEARGALARRDEIAPEDGRERVTVGEIEVPEARDGDVELHRIDAAAKNPLAYPALEQATDGLQKRRMQPLDEGGSLEVPALVPVVAVRQRDELGMGDLVLPGEADQAPQRVLGRPLVELEALLRLPHAGIGTLEHGQEERILAAEVVVEHAHVDAGLRGDAADARAAEPRGGELSRRGLEDLRPRALRVLDGGARRAERRSRRGAEAADIARLGGARHAERGAELSDYLIRALRPTRRQWGCFTGGHAPTRIAGGMLCT